MKKIINIANQKGGVGKTTTVLNLGVGLSLWEKKVLIIDFDPQGNSTTGIGILKKNLNHTIYSVLSGEINIKDAIIKFEKNPYLDFIPAGEDLSGFPMEVYDDNNRIYYLKNLVDQIKNDYEYILIDSPPSLNLLTLNSIVAATDVLIPVQAEFYALEGLAQLMMTLKKVERYTGKKVNILGFLVTMYDVRTSISKQVHQELTRYFEKKVLTTIIPRNVRISEAPGYGETVLTYAPASKGAFAYKELIAELLEK